MIEDVARLTRLLGFHDLGMPGPEGRRPLRGLSPEEQLTYQAVMAPLSVEIPWPLGIAARPHTHRDSMSLGVAPRWSSGSRGVSLRRWDGPCQVSDPGSLAGDTGPASWMPAERAFSMSTLELPSGSIAALPSPPLPSPHPSRHIPSGRPFPSTPGGADLGRSMSGWPPGVAADSSMSIGDIAPTWSGRLDAAPHRLDDHVRYLHADAAGTPANDVSNSIVSNSNVTDSRWGDEGTVARQRPLSSRPGAGAGHGQDVLTVMIRNLPPGLHQRRLISELDENGFHNTYGLVHMPTDLSTGQNKGFAFVNFFAEEHALQLMNAWNGTRRFGVRMDQMPLNLTPSRNQDSPHHLMQAKLEASSNPEPRVQAVCGQRYAGAVGWPGGGQARA